MAQHHLASVLRLPRKDKSVELRFNGNNYEFKFYNGRSSAYPAIALAPAQMRIVTVELLALEMGKLKISHENRYFAFRIDGEVWAKVPDVILMQLCSLAAAGRGECLSTL